MTTTPADLSRASPADWDGGWLREARHCPSPNFGPRPAGAAIDLLVVHSISLPPGQYGGPEVEQLFTNRLDWDAHPYFGQIRGLEVSSHFFIRRDGGLVQFVDTFERAWHAGRSCWRGRENCNDDSVGIELEGLEGDTFEPAQYASVAALCEALSGVFAITALVILITDGRPVLYISERMKTPTRGFQLVKFRTMRPDTASVASHLADASAITPLGAFLRRTKLDELPQLWNVLKGEMSLVGPRPCLFNQTELISERASRSVFNSRPGITGLAQVNNIDMSTPELLAETDARMLKELTVSAYFKYIFMTVGGKGSGDVVKAK